LFEKDKKMFSFLITVQILRQEGVISTEEWSFFLNKGGMVDEATLSEVPAEWMKVKTWAAISKLEEIQGFFGLTDNIRKNSSEWKAWYDLETPEKEKLPCGYEDKLNRFQRLLVLRALREEKVVAAVNLYILAELGKNFVESPPFDLKVSFNDSTTRTPIIFVLSPGADPMTYLLTLASDTGMRDRLKMISLGQGQGPIAQRMIEAARDTGDWVCLQNCHLAASWMQELERILEAQSTMKVHDDFRLWLTSMPSKAFPVSVLQSGIKLTNEPPKGLRANVKRTFDEMTDKYFASCSKTLPFQKMLFGLAFFHAAIQERRKFGPLGWNIAYEWNTSDILTAQENLRRYLEEQDEVPYETIRYVVGSINYGGRITDYWDQRTADCILSQYFTPDALDDSYRYTKDGIYYAPPVGDLDSVRGYIDQLPLLDSPETFGLHRNAAITFDSKETKYLIDTITSVQPRTGGGAGAKSPDEIVAEIAADIESRMPGLLDREKGHALTFALEAGGAMNSLGTFLLIEMGKFNKMIRTVKRTLHEIQRAIKGLVVMSADLEAMYNSFLVQQMPGLWSKVSYLSLKPLGSWVKDMLERVEFISNWVCNGPPPVYWMSAFFFPQGFLTASLQIYARNTAIAIDTLNFDTKVVNEDPRKMVEGPKTGVYIRGLFMEGAGWDESQNCIVESDPSVLFVPLPVIWLDPIDSGSMPDGAGVYHAPLYKVSSRAGTLSTTGHSTNFVRTLDLSTKEHPDHWVRRGVALLSQLDD